MRSTLPLFAIIAFGLGNCADEPYQQENPNKADIFGADDREEFYSRSISNEQRAVTQAAAALIATRRVQETTHPKLSRVVSQPLGEAFDLCEGVRFSEQPSAAHCSSFFVGNEAIENGQGIMVTAGHCFEGSNPQRSCDETKVVFDFVMPPTPSEDPTLVLNSSVYQCENILSYKVFRNVDYAVFRLDRTVTAFGSKDAARQAMQLRSPNEARSDSVYGAGYPSGIPLKLTARTGVKNYSYDSIESADGEQHIESLIFAPVDSMAGNSGGPWLGLDNVVEGIVVAGVSSTGGFESNVKLLDPSTWFDEASQCYGLIKYDEDGNWLGRVPIAYSVTAIVEQVDLALAGEMDALSW